MEGWIKAHRSMIDHWLWKEKPFSKGQAWVDILLLANHKEKEILLGNQVEKIKVGSFATSELHLMERWGWSKNKVRAFLNVLQSESMIVKDSNRKRTAINVVNYGKYQVLETTKEPQKNHEGTTKGLQKVHNQERKNEKNEKKEIKNIGRFSPPDSDTVREYCTERNNSVDPEAFVDFYTSKNWMVGKNKMKDWKAAVRTWEKNDRGQTRQEVTAKRDLISEVDNW